MPQNRKNALDACFALVPTVALVVALSIAGQAAAASTALPDEHTVTRAINHRYSDPSDEQITSPEYLTSGLAFLVEVAGLDDDGAMTCRERLPFNEKNSDAIEHSKAYQRVEKGCPGGTAIQDVVKLGLMTKTETSPYVMHYAMTDSGRKHMQMWPKRPDRYSVFLAHEAVEHVLKVDAADNPYHVPAADARVSVVPKIDDWAQPYVGPGKAISFRRYSPHKLTARLWKTDAGWQVFYIADR